MKRDGYVAVVAIVAIGAVAIIALRQSGAGPGLAAPTPTPTQAAPTPTQTAPAAPTEPVQGTHYGAPAPTGPEYPEPRHPEPRGELPPVPSVELMPPERLPDEDPDAFEVRLIAGEMLDDWRRLHGIDDDQFKRVLGVIADAAHHAAGRWAAGQMDTEVERREVMIPLSRFLSPEQLASFRRTVNIHLVTSHPPVRWDGR